MRVKNCVKILWFGLLLFVSSVSIGAGKIDFTDSTKSIIVKKSKPVFTIVLKSNPTTGYSWLLKSYDANLISPVGRKFFPDTSKKLVGAPGYEKWTFRVKPSGFVVPQTMSITLMYTRPWDEQGARITNFKVVTSHAN